MFINRYYEQDIKYTFKINRFLFRMMGVWPLASTKSFSNTAMTFLATAICFSLLLIEYISSMLYVFLVIKDTRVRVNVIGSTLYSIAVIIKYIYVLLTKDQVKNCLMAVEKDWQVIEPNARLLMIDKVKSGRRWLLMFAFFAYMTGFTVRLILPLSKGKVVTPANVTIRTLPCVAYFVIFDVQQTPAYEIVFTLQFFSGFLKYTITLATLSFLTLCVMHLCGQLNILITLMNNFVNEQQFENLNNRLALIVKHQIKTQHFLQLVQKAIQYPSLLEILSATVFVCFGGYYLLMHWENHDFMSLLTYCCVMSMFSSNIFIICYMGEQLIDKGEKIALRMCTLEWYRLPDTQARSLILVIIMSYVTPKLQGGKFFDISVKTFGNIIKMAMTYFNFLRTAQF